MPPKKPPVVRKPVAKPVPKPTTTRGRNVPAAPVKGKAGAKPKEPPKPNGPSKEELAAIKIQKYCRRYLAKLELEKLKKDKEDYDNLIEKVYYIRLTSLLFNHCHLFSEDFNP